MEACISQLRACNTTLTRILCLFIKFVLFLKKSPDLQGPIKPFQNYKWKEKNLLNSARANKVYKSHTNPFPRLEAVTHVYCLTFSASVYQMAPSPG